MAIIKENQEQCWLSYFSIIFSYTMQLMLPCLLFSRTLPKYMNLHHLKETEDKLWKQFMIGLQGYLEICGGDLWHDISLLKRFSVAINGNHIVEDQNECIQFFLDIYACWSSTMWFPFIATEKNTKALSVAINVTHVIEDQHAYISILA